MIDSIFDVGRPIAARAGEKAQPRLQVDGIDLQQTASRAAATWQVVRRPRNPESWKSDWTRTQGTILRLLADVEHKASAQPATENNQAEKLTAAWLWLKENPRLIRDAVLEISGSERELNRVPAVRAGSREI